MRDIAQEARNLVDEFRWWFQPSGPFTKEDWEPYMKLLIRWERVVSRFYMCMPSEGQQPEPIKMLLKNRFVFGPGQVLFDGKDLNIKTGLAQGVLKKLVKNFGHVVPFKELDDDTESSDSKASEQLREAISYLNPKLKDLQVKVENRRGYGYIMSSS